MKIEVYSFEFDVVLDPLYRLDDNYNVEIILFELRDDGFKVYTVYSSNKHYYVKTFKTNPRYVGTDREMSAREAAIIKIQEVYTKYLNEGCTDDIVDLELKRIDKIKERLKDRRKYLKRIRRESLTKVPKKFVWYNYEEISSPIRIVYAD